MWPSTKLHPVGTNAAGSGSFLFTVVSPVCGVTRFPLRWGAAESAVWSKVTRGPTFGVADIALVNHHWGTATGIFSSSCTARVGGGSYEDVLGTGDATFTGGRTFCPVEVEVYHVLPASSPDSAAVTEIMASDQQ